MIARHSFELICRCPKSGRMDNYSVMIEVHDDVLLAEDIEKVASEFLGAEVFQEDLTSALSHRLGDALVRVTGRHGMVTTDTSHP